MKKCIYAGSFDPLTIGHEDIIEKCLEGFDSVLIVIGENANKNCYFSLDERKRIINAVYGEDKRVEVIDYASNKDRYSEFLKEKGYNYYVRGIRNEKDKAFEDAYKKINEKEYPFITTEYIYASKKYSLISSTIVREKIIKNEDFSSLVSKKVKDEIDKILDEKTAK